MPGPVFAVIAELSAVVGLVAAVFGVLCKYQDWRNKQKIGDRIEKGDFPVGRVDYDVESPSPSAALLAHVPSWVFPTVITVGLVMVCGGCFSSLLSHRPDPVERTDLKGKDQEKDKGPVDKQAGRKVALNRPIESWDDRLGITLENVEFRKDNKLRWNFSFANKTGRYADAPVSPHHGASYLLDQDGAKSAAVAHSEGNNLGIGVPDGEKKPYWIDFQMPAATATRVVGYFPRSADGRQGLPAVGLELVPGPDGPGVSGDTLIRTVRLGKGLATWNPQVACTLESVEFRPEGRMRWRYTFWNKSGAGTEVFTYPERDTSYLTDEKGGKHTGVAHAAGTNLAVFLPDGEKTAVWIDFKSPPPDAAWLTTHFGSGQLNPERKVPDVVLHLPPGKAGPMAALTFAADAGAAVLDETLDLTLGGGSAKLHVTKDRPRAETAVIVPTGTDVRYTARATTRVNINGKEATYQGTGAGSYVVPSDRRLVYVRDTAAGFTNFRVVFQEPR